MPTSLGQSLRSRQSLIKELAPNSKEGVRARELISRAAQLQTECGCALGGKFFLVGGGFATVYLAQQLHLPLDVFLKRSLLVAPAVFAFSLIGKFAGIGMARFQLGVVRRRLDELLQHVRMTHVGVHEGGR